MAIGRFDARELAQEVLRSLEVDGDKTVKAKCAWVLGHFRWKPAWEILKACLEDEDEDENVRIWAAWAIGEIATTRDEAYLSRMVSRAQSPGLQRAIGGALKKVNLGSVRVPARHVARQLWPPASGDPRIRRIVERLQILQADPAPKLPLLVELRRELKSIDEAYFQLYMEWLGRKPALQRASEDRRAVYKN